jgi:hypothetical protein
MGFETSFFALKTAVVALAKIKHEAECLGRCVRMSPLQTRYAAG